MLRSLTDHPWLINADCKVDAMEVADPEMWALRTSLDDSILQAVGGERSFCDAMTLTQWARYLAALNL